MKKYLYGVIALLHILFSFAAHADAQKSLLIHATTSLKIDDAQVCAVPNVAWSALKQGYEVSILFDASAVTALKKGGLFGGDKSPLDKALLPERERLSLARQFHEPLKNIPHNYGEYIQLLHSKGVKIYANRTMMLLYEIEENEIVPNIKTLKLAEMVKLLTANHAYVSY